jgi:hypothetical protein
MMVNEISGVKIPDSQLAREATRFIRDTESDLLFQHSTRVYFWGALAGKRKGLTFDPELLYTAAMFHDVGLTSGFRESRLRFEVDGANAARAFLRSHGILESEIEKVWLAIALHTTPGISEHLNPIAALAAEGVMMDLKGVGYDEFTDAQREGGGDGPPPSAAIHGEPSPDVLRRPQAPAGNDPIHRPRRYHGRPGPPFSPRRLLQPDAELAFG